MAGTVTAALAGRYLHWSGDSSKVHFALGDELFTRELKNAFTFVPGRLMWRLFLG